MKKSLLALTFLGAAGVAQAQSSVVIYGTLDVGVSKRTGTTTQVGKRDNNKLGFKGVEDLGNGVNALFQLEIRYEPDTGTLESNSRPLFQGQSRVGLQGAFGTVRLGRGLTPFMESIDAFDPWSGLPTPAGFKTDIQVAGYTSDPLSAAGNSGNRFSNALFYNSPLLRGFQLNVAVASKEANGGPVIIGRGTALAPQFTANSGADVVPYGVSATYNLGMFGALAAYERNAIDSHFWSVAGSIKPVTGLKLMASYQRQDQGETQFFNYGTKAWLVGANYVTGANKFLAGYGRKQPDNLTRTKQFSLGYEYSLSPRTYAYAEASDKRQPQTLTTGTNLKFYAIGLHHLF